MSECTMCGAWVPDGQKTCSMCYGDVDHGNDGYYEDHLRQQELEEYSNRLEELERELKDGTI